MVIMRLSTISSLYGGAGPWASVYLDATGTERSGTPHESRQELELRWRAAREELQREGADDATLAAIDDAIGAAPSVVGPTSVAVLASHGVVALARTLPVTPTRQVATWSTQPHAADLLRAVDGVSEPGAAGPQFASSTRGFGDDVRWVRADVDRTGGTITSFDGQSSRLHGEDEFITKTSDHAKDRIWSNPPDQRAAEVNWDRNSTDVARALQEAVDRARAEVVVLAGDVRARQLVLDRLPPLVAERVVEVDHEVPIRPHPESRLRDRREADVTDPLLAGATRAAIDITKAARRRAGADRFHSGLSSGQSVRGLGPVSRAARELRIDTLVLSTEPTDRLAWVDPFHPTMVGESTGDTGVESAAREPADDAIVGAAAVAGVDALIIEPDPELVDGLGAILRYVP